MSGEAIAMRPICSRCEVRVGPGETVVPLYQTDWLNDIKPYEVCVKPELLWAHLLCILEDAADLASRY